MGVPFLTLTVCREVFSHFQTWASIKLRLKVIEDPKQPNSGYNPTAATSNTLHFVLHCLHVLHYQEYPVCYYLSEREREDILS